MSRMKDYLMSEVEGGRMVYNPHKREYEPLRPTIKRMSDKDISKQSLAESIERLGALLERHNQLTKRGV